MGKRTDKSLKGGINSATSRAGDDCCKLFDFDQSMLLLHCYLLCIVLSIMYFITLYHLISLDIIYLFSIFYDGCIRVRLTLSFLLSIICIYIVLYLFFAELFFLLRTISLCTTTITRHICGGHN